MEITTNPKVTEATEIIKTITKEKNKHVKEYLRMNAKYMVVKNGKTYTRTRIKKLTAAT